MGRRQGLRGRLVLLLMAAALVGGLLPPFPPPAQAAALVLSPTCTMPGGSVSASGSGAPPGMWVTFHMPQAMGWTSLQVPVGSTRADMKGKFKGGFGVPSGLAAGSYTVEARWAQGLGSGLLGAASLTVVVSASACPQEAGPEGLPEIVNDVYMVSANDGWAVGKPGGNKRFWRYDGAAWTVYPQDFPEGGGLGFDSLYMVSATDGWAIGHEGFYRYNGQSWSPQQLPIGHGGLWFNDIHMIDSTEGWAVVGDSILHYDGTQWSVQFQYHEPGKPFYSIRMVSRQEGWAAKKSLYHYKDGQWTLYQVQDPKLGVIDAYFISMLSPTEGWATGSGFLSAPNETVSVDFILRYDGTQWKVEAMSTDPDWGCPRTYLRSIFTFSSRAALAVGRNCILRYDGEKWKAQPLPAPQREAVPAAGQLQALEFQSVFMTSPSQAWIAGWEDWGALAYGGFYRYTGASLTLDPTSGVAGTPVIAKGSGFSTDSQVGLSWGGSLSLAKVWPKTDGSFTTTVVVPGETLTGTYKLVAEAELADADGATRSAEAGFRVTALPQGATVYSITAPASAYARLAGSYGNTPPGEIDGQYTLKVRVSRVQPLPWQPASGVGVTFNLLESPQGVSLSASSATTDSQGWAGVTINLGQTEGNTIVAVASGTASAKVLIRAFRQQSPPSGLPPGFVPGAITGGLSEPPQIRVKPSSGPPGTQVEVQGSGFQSSFVDVYFDGQTRLGGTYSFLGSLGGTLKVEVPAGTSVGDHTITAINKAGDYASATFTVGSPASLLPTPTPTATPTPGVGCAAVDAPCALPTATPTPKPTATPTGAGLVRGVVYDSTSGKPVSPNLGTSSERARVQWGTAAETKTFAEATTDEEGRYTLTLPQGVHFLRAVNDWYEGGGSPIGGLYVEVSAGKTVTRDFYLTRKQGAVQGRVGLFGAAGQLIQGTAGVVITLKDLYTSRNFETLSGPDGTFSLTLPVGNYKMLAGITGDVSLLPALEQHNKGMGNLLVKVGAIFHDVVLPAIKAAPEPGQGYQISGSVKDSLTGELLAGTSLKLWTTLADQAYNSPCAFDKEVATTTTDKDGNFRLADLAAGTYLVSLSHPSLTFDPPSQCVKVQSFNVGALVFTTAKPSFLTTSCPVSGQERRLQSSWLQEFLDYIRSALSYIVPYSESPAAVEARVKTYETTMNQVNAYNTAVATALANDDPNMPIRLDSLLIDEAWAAQQKPGVLNRLLVDLGPYWKKIKTSASADLTLSDRKVIVGILSGYYKQFPRGASQCSSPRFQVKGHSPFTLLVTDEEGQQTGVDPFTGAQVNQIPGASYTGPLTETQVVEGPYPSGRYWVEATGTGTGHYGIDVVGLLGQKAVVTSTLTGTIQTGATFLSAASVGASGLEPTVQVSVPSTMTRKVYLPFLASSAQGW